LFPENEVFLEDDDEKGREPVPHTKEERVQDRGEVFSAGDRGDHVDDHASKSPYEARDFGCPVANDLSGKTELLVSRRQTGLYRVIVRDVVCDNGQCKEDEAEFAESTRGG
jgi:hypothetical protein